MSKHKFYEFFAGGGMARLGLGDEWECVFANDFSPRKAASYRENFPPADELHVGDVFDIDVDDLPKNADLAWASFPCQDLSLAGKGQGLDGRHSGSFWGFWRLVEQLDRAGDPVPVVVLENVVGTITTHDGNDFGVLLTELVDAGYRVGPLVIDALHFLPQSRPRLFIVGVHRRLGVPDYLMSAIADNRWHPSSLVRAFSASSQVVKDNWIWWRLPHPVRRPEPLSRLIDADSDSEEWHSKQQTQRLIDLMSPLHRSKLTMLQHAGRPVVATVYRRIRSVGGEKLQRAELRADEVSGCIRTGSGGSSKQFILVIEGERIHSRLLSPREAARLMGLPDTYVLPKRASEAYFLMGDGVVVPVVEWLADNILTPLVDAQASPYMTRIPTLGIEQQRLLERKSSPLQ